MQAGRDILVAMTLVALLHGAGWRPDVAAVQLAPNTSLCAYEGSRVQKTYERLCSTRGTDGGEPLHFEVYLHFEGADLGASNPEDFGEPESVVGRVANLITLATESPVDYARILVIDRRYRVTYTDVAWRIGLWTSIFSDTVPRRQYASDAPDELIRMWQVIAGSQPSAQSAGRVENALVYFYHSWRSYHADQACLHLAVAIEVLFAPHVQSETSHQIAFNVARFIGDDASSRERAYQTTRRFYSVRSSIVHGGMPEWQKLSAAYLKMFSLFADVLRRLMSDAQLVHTFDNEDRRKQLFRGYLFD